MLAQFSQPQFWIDVLKITWVDALLSGDNAVMIAMACRGLPQPQRRRGMIAGAGMAAILLIAFTVLISALMRLPYLRLISAGVLVWVAIKLVAKPPADRAGTREAAGTWWQVMQLVVIADLIMSLDNAVAVAAVANGRFILLGFGLAISIPIVIAGSAVILALLVRFPIIIWAGAALLGWVAGQLFVSDPVVGALLARLGSTLGAEQVTNDQTSFDAPALAAGALGAAIVLLAGWLWRRPPVPLQRPTQAPGEPDTIRNNEPER